MKLEEVDNILKQKQITLQKVIVLLPRAGRHVW
jgi:hypothetical protein